MYLMYLNTHSSCQDEPFQLFPVQLMGDRWYQNMPCCEGLKNVGYDITKI